MSVYFTQRDLQNMKIYPLKEEFGPVDIPEKNIKPSTLSFKQIFTPW